MRQKALENCPPNLQANAEGKANPAFLDMISRESDLREKLRQYDTIKRAITAIDESVISKSTTMMRTSSEPEPLKIMLVYRLDELESDGMKKKADLLRSCEKGHNLTALHATCIECQREKKCQICAILQLSI